MRRGRPNQLGTEQPATKPYSSPNRPNGNDPFSLLDGSKITSGAPDDISNRFPPLDQFTLLHDAGNKFAFDTSTKPAAIVPGLPRELSQRVTEALADDAFIQPANSEPSVVPRKQTTPPISVSQPSPATPKVDISSHKSVASLIQSMNNAGTQTDPSSPEIPKKPPTSSTGTMTSPRLTEFEKAISSGQPLYRLPSSDHQRSFSQSRIPTTVPLLREKPDNDFSSGARLSINHQQQQQPNSQMKTLKPSQTLQLVEPWQTEDDSLTRTKSEAARRRPLSAQFDTTKFSAARSSSIGGRGQLDSTKQLFNDDSTNIASNVEFLKKMEEEDPTKKKEKRQSSGSKYAKLSLSGTKNLFAGRFGDAFKRFESGQPGGDDDEVEDNLTPITGSIATDGRSDDGQAIEETEESTPEVRRELERRRLSQEERRVTEAAAAYKQRVAENGVVRGRDVNRAALIQNKVQSLLEESNKSPTKTAAGYGRFTTDGSTSAPVLPDRKSTPLTPKQPVPNTTNQSVLPPSISRPFAPPKPPIFRTGGQVISPAPSPNIVTKPSHLISKSKPADRPSGQSNSLSPEDWEAQFSKRYPSLSGLEMVETEITSDGRVIRDV